MFSQNHVTEMIPAYALDCLEREETLLVSEHISQCSACQAELAKYQQVVNDFPLAAPEAVPPAELKQKILRGLQPERETQRSTRTMPGRSSFWAWLQKSAPALAILSLVLIVFMASGNLWLLRRVNQLQSAVPAEFGLVTLTGTTFAPKATGMLVVSQDGNLGTLIVDSLPALDSAHQYQLWLIQDGKRTSGGVFSVSKDGYGALTVNSPMPLISYKTFGITVEPTGGSPGPTGEKVMGGGL